MLRRFSAVDYAPAIATVEDTETRRWVNAIPADNADSMVRLCERERRRKGVLRSAVMVRGHRIDVVSYSRLPAG